MSQPSAPTGKRLVRRSSIVTWSGHAYSSSSSLDLRRCHSKAIPADAQMAEASAQIRWTSESLVSSGASTATGMDATAASQLADNKRIMRHRLIVTYGGITATVGNIPGAQLSALRAAQSTRENLLRESLSVAI